MSNLVCRKCGDTDIYLQYKGAAVGAYCASCGSWHKWVGKKELPMYQRMGKAVHKEGLPITLKQTNDIPSIMPLSFNGVQKQADLGVTPNHSNLGVSNDEPDWVKHVNDNADEELPFEPIRTSEPSVQMRAKSELCSVCNGEPLEVVGDSKVDVMIFDGVLTITDKEGVEILGTYRLKVCPNCGKEY